jgi:hypothetical protein
MTSELRLFQLRQGKFGPVINQAGYFPNKMAAKAVRDTIEGAVVSYGPDHDKFIARKEK